jgi:hypothetical protein
VLLFFETPIRFASVIFEERKDQKTPSKFSQPFPNQFVDQKPSNFDLLRNFIEILISQYCRMNLQLSLFEMEALSIFIFIFY